MLSFERVHAVLSYDPATGVFRHKVKRGNRAAGDEAGTVNSHNGYRYICIDYRDYLAGRLAIFMSTGSWPMAEVDHRNGRRDDNRLGNLRTATRLQNAANKGVPRSNTSGEIGVVWDRNRRRWRAQITINGKTKNLGRFALKEDAAAAYRVAAHERKGEWQRGHHAD